MQNNNSSMTAEISKNNGRNKKKFSAMFTPKQYLGLIKICEKTGDSMNHHVRAAVNMYLDSKS